MSEEKEQLSWKKRFLANRVTFESILFEKELVIPAREKLSAGLLGAAGIWLFGTLLLVQWVLRQGHSFPAADLAGFERINAYAAQISSGGFWSLFQPVISGFELDPTPPLYYLSYVPVFRFLASDFVAAMLIVNSFYLLIIALAIFLAVKKSRNNFSGWLGTAFVTGMPFTLEAARHPEPELAAMAMAAAAYCCYINSEDLEHPDWSFWFSVFFSLGFFAHSHFWVWALPLVPFIIPAVVGYAARNEILKGLFLGVVLNLQWYSVFFISRFSGLYRPETQSAGFWTYFSLSAQAASLPFFIIGGVTLLWMYFSVFMPYANRKIVAAWFWAPCLALTYLAGTNAPKLIYPALFPLAIATAVMTPNFIRKYILWLALGLAFLNQIGLVPPLRIGGYPVAGLGTPHKDGRRVAEILENLTPQSPGPLRVLVAGGDNSFTPSIFRLSAAARGGAKNIFFYNRSGLAPAFADYIVFKTRRYGEALGGANSFSSIFLEPWFGLLFEKKRELELKDTSKVVIYAKRRQTVEPFAAGKYAIDKYSLGGFEFENAELTLENFDPLKSGYARALFFARAASYEDVDIYGLTLELKDFRVFSAAPVLSEQDAGSADEVAAVKPRFRRKGVPELDNSDLVVAGVGAIKVVLAQVNTKDVERFLAKRLQFLGRPKVTLTPTILRYSDLHRKINAEFSLEVKRNSLFTLKLDSFEWAGYHVPKFVARNLAFNYDFALSPYMLSFDTINMPLTGRFY
ncbi:MAG TPA: hypothetical protein DCL44_00090 [Elusimicrobia bacterium]|nr:hypothetical protein [Elusimicrobiota bacterium]